MKLALCFIALGVAFTASAKEKKYERKNQEVTNAIEFDPKKLNEIPSFVELIEQNNQGQKEYFVMSGGNKQPVKEKDMIILNYFVVPRENFDNFYKEKVTP